MSAPEPHDTASHLQSRDDFPLTAWFLGPRAENAVAWSELLDHIFTDYVHWRRNYFPADPWIVGRVRRRSDEHESWYDWLTSHLDVILAELKYHFPFHSPRYNAHMLSELSLPAVLGYFAGLLYNPNNVTAEAAPITVALELEVGRMISAMLGYNPKRAWAHICSGGTVATIEALWVARAAQFAPLIAREICQERGLAFPVRTPNGRTSPIAGLDDLALVSLRPNDSITILRELARHISETENRPMVEALEIVNHGLAGSRYNVARRGLGAIMAETGLRPVVFASAAAHYSIAKACNVLGYGEEAARLIPVNERFQIDVDALGAAIREMAPGEYIAAVVGIVGTTEEGAVDPIHRIRFLRDECERSLDRSFWIHVDAAWGGYLRSLFHGLPVQQVPHGAGLDAVCEEYVRVLQMNERIELDVGVGRPDVRTLDIHWNDHETYAAFLAMADGDSTTVDPHKMGYVPYPAGVIAFRNGAVNELVTQRAQYISDAREGLDPERAFGPAASVGPHILEGSKPGAAALACWLAHRTIPLTATGHGKIVRVTLLNARRLARLLAYHHHLFARFEAERAPDPPSSTPFTFFPVAEPETNLVCFVARPMRWEDGAMVPAEVPLGTINRLNESIYRAASIPAERVHHRATATQPFFVSRTRFEHEQYSASSLGRLLTRLGISEMDYVREGLFVLRSTVMNPWHTEAREAGLDYLYEFVKFLHQAAAEALGEGREGGRAGGREGGRT
ncbi:MAG: pyridoxal-dependent decarboxylase, partial [Gemmatimonadota bacterium]|nr:pyridoxal-dependent decarboxylase [Gemmatimonadota bacterium]